MLIIEKFRSLAVAKLVVASNVFISILRCLKYIKDFIIGSLYINDEFK